MRKPRVEDYVDFSDTKEDLQKTLSDSEVGPSPFFLAGFGIACVWCLGVMSAPFLYLFGPTQLKAVVEPLLDSGSLGLFGAAFAPGLLLGTLAHLTSKLGPMSAGAKLRKARQDTAREKLAKFELFEAGQSKYEAYTSETSRDFWRRLRGVDLERRVANMLRRVGWQVRTTSTTGDGGIDLIGERNGETVYFQCKGLKGCAGVGVIRDAAGVSSVSSKRVVVVAPNGFTKPSRIFASKANIELWDSQMLVKVATETM